MDQSLPAALGCWIYRSGRKEGTYLYLLEEEGFSCVPAPLMQAFGKPTFVMQLELSAERKLAQVDVIAVMRSLVDQGYFLQVPPPVESLLPRRDL